MKWRVHSQERGELSWLKQKRAKIHVPFKYSTLIAEEISLPYCPQGRRIISSQSNGSGTSLVVRWLRFHLPVQRTWVIPGRGRFHTPGSNEVCAPQLLSPRAAITEAPVPRAWALQRGSHRTLSPPYSEGGRGQFPHLWAHVPLLSRCSQVLDSASLGCTGSTLMPSRLVCLPQRPILTEGTRRMASKPETRAMTQHSWSLKGPKIAQYACRNVALILHKGGEFPSFFLSFFFYQ